MSLEQAIGRFLKKLERNQVNMHGFMLMHKGEVVSEGFWAPFTKDTPHRMFSVGKSVTSLLIGILEGEGKLRLLDKIMDYFPDKCPAEMDAHIAAMTIEDMLKMATAHKFTSYKCVKEDDWTSTFFTVPASNAPGMVFAYDTSSSHTLSALIQRLTGMSLLDYFKEKLYNPLGMTSKVRWLTDPVGVCQGGSGLILSPADLMKLAACVMRGGDGLIPEDYIKRATVKQIDTLLNPLREERFGYGYQFWRTRENGFCMYGMGGQFALMLPDKALILVTIADTQMHTGGNQDLFDAFFEEIVPYVDSWAVEKLTPLELNMKPIENSGQFEEYPENAYGFENFIFEQARLAKGEFQYIMDGKLCVLPFNVGAVKAAKLPGTSEPCLVTAGFIAPGQFLMNVHIIGDTPCGFNLLCVFNQLEMTIKMRSVSDPISTKYDGVSTGGAI